MRIPMRYEYRAKIRTRRISDLNRRDVCDRESVLDIVCYILLSRRFDR